VYYLRGEFDRASNRNIRGPFQHDVTFRMGLTVSAAATVNLGLINDPESTAGEITAVLAAFHDASELADGYIDELAELVWQILMDARNYDLGMTKGTVSNRWVAQISKDDPLPRGELVVLSGIMDMTCRMTEESLGATPVAAGVYDATIDIQGDDVEATGVAGTLGG
jgi:hypothetical protein